MGIVHPIRLSDCQLRLWNHPKQVDIDFDFTIDEKQLEKQIEKTIDTALTNAIKKINGK